MGVSFQGFTQQNGWCPFGVPLTPTQKGETLKYHHILSNGSSKHQTIMTMPNNKWFKLIRILFGIPPKKQRKTAPNAGPGAAHRPPRFAALRFAWDRCWNRLVAMRTTKGYSHARARVATSRASGARAVGNGTHFCGIDEKGPTAKEEPPRKQRGGDSLAPSSKKDSQKYYRSGLDSPP